MAGRQMRPVIFNIQMNRGEWNVRTTRADGWRTLFAAVASRRGGPGPHQMTHARTHASFTGKHNNVVAAAAVAAAGLTNCMSSCTWHTQAHALRPVIAGTMEGGGGGSHLAAEAIIWEPPQWASSVASPLSLENGHVDFAATGYSFSGNAGRNFQDSLSCHRRFLLYEPERHLLSRPAW